jgi:hypothetical protein
MSLGRRQAATRKQCNTVLRTVQVTFLEQATNPATVIEFKQIEFVDHTGTEGCPRNPLEVGRFPALAYREEAGITLRGPPESLGLARETKEL